MGKQDLSTRTVRRRLQPRHRPYWQRIARGRALGYRRASTGAGVFYVRVRVGGDGDPYTWRALGTADDLPHVPADGEDVLTYAQAVEAARAFDPDAEPDPEPDVITVADAVARYQEWADEHRGRSAQEARYNFEAHVLPELGDVAIENLTTDRLRKWHQRLARKPARVRSPKGRQRYREATTGDEQRARRATANRVLSNLKAALNRCWRDGKISGGRDVWHRVEAFKGVERSRARYLDTDEIRRLLNAIDTLDFRDLVRGALYTGCRYQELARLRIQDVSLDSGAVRIHQSKTDKARAVYLNSEAVEFFEAVTAGRPARDRVFHRAGKPWKKAEQRGPMLAACRAAKLEPPVTFHGLRHTYASLYLMAGGGLPDLAKQLGHSTTRMVERHYGHLSDAWRGRQAQKFAPSFGVAPGKVRRLAGKQG